MFRKRGSSKEMEPEVVLLLRHQSRYPGDLLQGVVIVDIPFPSDILALEVRVCGDERSILGGLFVTDKNPEARKTTYYEQFITLRGVDHDLLDSKRSLRNCRRIAEAQGVRTGFKSAPHRQSLPAGDVVPELSASVIQNASEAAVHLIPGTYSYPFSLVLPDNLPASCELYRGRDGRCVLRYHAVASLIMTSGKIHTSEARLRMNPLPVQVQRWYQLHEDEQQLCEAAEDGGDAYYNETESRAGVLSRLMSSAGTMRADKAEWDSEIAHQRRIRHYRQFPEDQLMLEAAVYAETAGERAERKKRRACERNARERGSLLVAAETTAVTNGSARILQNQREQEDAENRSVDTKDGAAGAANESDDAATAKVYDFGPEAPSPTAAASIRGEEEYGNGRFHSNSGGTNVGRRRALENRGKKKRHHHSHERDAMDSPAHTAMVENNVDKLTFTPPGGELPAPMAVRHVNQTEAVSHETAHGSSEEEREGRQSRSAHPHRRSSRFQPPPWNQGFSISLRSGFLRTGKVRVLLSLRSPLVTVGIGKVGATILIDNSDGSGAISRVKYSLVTQCYIRTKTEVYNFPVDTVETSSDISVEKGKVVKLPEVELPVPKSTPLTMLTEGMGTLTFLSVRLYVSTALKTFSRSVATEVVLVSGQDVLNCSRRLLRWTCFFRRRNGEDARDFTLRPPTINLSEKNSKLRIIDGSTRGAAREQLGPSLQRDDSDTSTMAASAVSRSMRILRTSQRISKAAPPIDVRLLAKTLNYEEALFVPRDDDDGSSFPRHVDPLAGLNPFVAPASDVISNLAEGDNYETLCH
ncbi:Arrestin (or S-antigen), N-terminal domain family protein [Leishmania donovani]|uniref:Arrestin (Or S-antigen), N-terminal domain family protein n=1 Tax=Leishmania donovani TaxID=5661 RepID=A0A504WZD3_LEIDO|nr:Arrestin (or S-antigen), N-terminal domain family protein [Leishmania donovani]VDZ49636.1 Arrestin_(or_S-antigen)_N-inal_domain/Arrestin_N_inal_like_putative/Pfam:PF00339/Pfam:PF13002 [Leishmania donovani]